MRDYIFAEDRLGATKLPMKAHCDVLSLLMDAFIVRVSLSVLEQVTMGTKNHQKLTFPPQNADMKIFAFPHQIDQYFHQDLFLPNYHLI